MSEKEEWVKKYLEEIHNCSWCNKPVDYKLGIPKECSVQLTITEENGKKIAYLNMFCSKECKDKWNKSIKEKE